jgi:hypothetical protein
MNRSNRVGPFAQKTVWSRPRTRETEKTEDLSAQPDAISSASRMRHRSLQRPSVEVANMLYTLAVILLIAWLLGVVGTYTIGAFVHVLLVIALVLFLVGLLSGRETIV